MPIVTERKKAMEAADRCRDNKTSMAVFCTASHWNTEAILLAAKRFAEKNNITNIPVTVAMTFNYDHMPQARRVTYAGDARIGFVSVMQHLKVLCSEAGSPYENITVLPHLDHADPEKDRWALTEGLPYLASVMFDAQKYAMEENIALTKDYIGAYGSSVLVEGVMEGLSVEGSAAGKGGDDYIEKATDYLKKTGVDFLVADLGTEQQSSAVGRCEYRRDRAAEITKRLGKEMLVLHGTSCLSEAQMASLAQDGVTRVNMWTRIAREAGQYAADKVMEHYGYIKEGRFEAAESREYIYNSIEKASEIMENILQILGYANLR